MATMLETMFEIDSVMAKAPFYAMLTLPASKQLLKKGFAEVNHDITNNDSQFATRLTAAGVEYLNTNTESADAAPTKKAITMTATTFPILSNIHKPESEKRVRAAGAGRTSKYDFAAMEVGQVIFAANSAVKSGDAFKTLTSAANMAMVRFSEKTGEIRTNRKGVEVEAMTRTREFSVRSYTLEGVEGAGVWRDK